jgi:hypothetical protein
MEQILSATNGRIVVGAEAVTLYSPLAEAEVSRVDFQQMIEELSAKQVGLTDSSQQAATTDSSGGPLTIVSHTFSGSARSSDWAEIKDQQQLHLLLGAWELGELRNSL